MSADWTRHLAEGERILWEGRPSDRLFVLRGYDRFILPFAILWAAISLGVLILGALFDPMMLVTGLIFAAVAIYLGVGRFLVGQGRRKRTRYALTNRRALIATDGQAPAAMELTPDLPVSHREGRNGRVTFGPVVPAFSNRSSAAAIAGRDADFTFCGLDDAKAVHDLAVRITTGELS